MVLALVGFAPMLIDLGTSEGLPRRRILRDPSQCAVLVEHGDRVVLTVLLVGASGLIARFFGEPSLTGIVLVSSLTLTMTAVSKPALRADAKSHAVFARSRWSISLPTWLAAL